MKFRQGLAGLVLGASLLFQTSDSCADSVGSRINIDIYTENFVQRNYVKDEETKDVIKIIEDVQQEKNYEENKKIDWKVLTIEPKHRYDRIESTPDELAKPKDQQKPNYLTYIFLGVGSALIALYASKKIREFCS